MTCSTCGCDSLPEDRFCEACGTPQAPRIEASPPPSAPARTTASTPRCSCGGTSFDAEGYCADCGNKQKSIEPIAAEELTDDLAWASHVGLRHTENQDCAGIKRLEDGRVLLVVSDGVSSAQDARAASHLVVQTVLDLASSDAHGGEAALNAAITAAHAALVQMPYTDLHKQEPQATVVAALADGTDVCLGWVGDSRAYRITADATTHLTEDDSWLNEAVHAGIAMDKALHDPNAHAITQCLGMRDDTPEVHTKRITLAAGDWLMLCSDGLWNYADGDAEMNAVVQKFIGLTARGLGEALVAFANASGGMDNTSVAALRV